MTHLVFDPQTGLETPETAAIRQAVAADWTSAFADGDLPPLNTEPSSPAGQLIDAQVAEIEAKNAEMVYLSNMFDPRVADGRWQDALGYIYFLTRKLDEPTVVVCQAGGLPGTAIPYGALVQNTEGLNLVCTRSATIGPDGTAEAIFRCVDTGSLEVPAGSVNRIVTAVPGWDAVTNLVAGTPGRDVESRAAFEERRAASVAANAHGSVSAVHGAVANLEGVLDVRVLENTGPDPVVKHGVTVPGHGITVCVHGGEDQAIAEAIYRKKDAGCDTGGNTVVRHVAAEYSGAVYEYRILRPATVRFWVKVTLGTGSFLPDGLLAAIKDAVVADFLGRSEVTGNSRVGLASTVYASRFYMPVVGIEGVTNLAGIEIALGNTVAASDYGPVLAVKGDQEPVISLDTVSVSVQS